MIYGDERINMHITIMSVIGIFMAAYGLSLREVEAIIMLAALPMICSILFWKFKHPVFGVAYTVLYVLNRIDLFFRPRGTLLGYAIIIALFAYFVYVDYQSCIRLKEIKEWKSNKDVE